ncbi:hypothetical protein F2P56_008063 [Juglans regia]|uniref:Pentatricopeptide repeat-containing protein n=1 Tax=Juglans regia TaxID=51240 RepID=A0A834D3W3_JUGRE|nr:hypothetical protein F2P56_008063 [Juglans regia]
MQRCIPKGRRADHGKIITSGFRLDVYANNHLISLYAKSNRKDDARKVFDAMLEMNLILWTALTSGYSQIGFKEEALNCFILMVIDGFNPNPYTYVGAISACASIGDVRAGKKIQGRIYRRMSKS